MVTFGAPCPLPPRLMEPRQGSAWCSRCDRHSRCSHREASARSSRAASSRSPNRPGPASTSSSTQPPCADWRRCGAGCEASAVSSGLAEGAAKRSATRGEHRLQVRPHTEGRCANGEQTRSGQLSLCRGESGISERDQAIFPEISSSSLLLSKEGRRHFGNATWSPGVDPRFRERSPAWEWTRHLGKGGARGWARRLGDKSGTVRCSLSPD